MSDTAVQGIFDEIQGVNAHFMKCWANGDFKSLSEIYTENCKILATGCDTQLGRQAAHDMFSGEFKQGFVKVILKSDEVGPGDAKDAAFEYGHYTFCDKDDKELDYGKYVVIWKRINGKLQMYLDMFNSNKA